MLIEHGADVNQANNIGTTPLIIATQEGHFEALQLLIDAGAYLNTQDKDGRTPLHFIYRNSVEIAKSPF